MKARREHPLSESRRIDLAAAEWLAKRDQGFTAREQDEFLQWLAADSRHRVWFANHERTWREFDQLAQWRPEHSIEPNPDLLARRPAVRRQRAIYLLAMAAGVVLSIALWQARPRTGNGSSTIDLVAQNYERRALEDGSTVELNRGAVLRVQFSAQRRSVALLHGEAHFTVAKDARRPFVVRARDIDVRAVGTAFNVKLAGDSCEVLVTEGRVTLMRPEAAAPEKERVARTRDDPAPTFPPAPRPLAPELSAGQRAIVEREADRPTRVTTISAEEMAQALSWQPQWLDFSSTPLAEVVAELNRRNRVQLVLAEADLGSLPIVASIRSDNVDGFVRLLTALATVQAERRGPEEIVLRRKPSVERE